ncbi:MAG: NAD-dependent epimerase/dehydratase family protein [Saprospiraceae bacterium]|jgi:CDP-paratose 2-epimerase|nr:NAD-dependent epimerase/dehydratase family protein [Saprospiraceae bacterium]MBP9210995.1 NAD-dependent epimerase/dehydratase family protein [Saprospiraceae bacterium]
MSNVRPKLVVTGSSGLIGSALVRHFDGRGWSVFGIDNNMRADFFGPKGDTRWNQHLLESQCSNFRHCEIDIRDRGGVERLICEIRPDFVAHAAAQPSHDLAATRPFDDFDVNAGGTLNLLEACRKHCPEAPFAFMSTNKVYGDGPNRLPLLELETRYDYADGHFADGIREDFPVDQSMHSLFGASKLAADVMVQEYGRYFGMPTCVLRGGCLTGPSHSGVELHGFISYLVKVNLEGERYRVFGYRGKQVRDNIHSEDVARFIECFFERPRVAEVYNIGGGRHNSCSILEAFDAVSSLSGRAMQWEYIEENRKGDHICYISDLSKMRTHYPSWDIQKSLEDIYVEIVRAWYERLSAV